MNHFCFLNEDDLSTSQQPKYPKPACWQVAALVFIATSQHQMYFEVKTPQKHTAEVKTQKKLSRKGGFGFFLFPKRLQELEKRHLLETKGLGDLATSDTEDWLRPRKELVDLETELRQMQEVPSTAVYLGVSRNGSVFRCLVFLFLP